MRRAAFIAIARVGQTASWIPGPIGDAAARMTSRARWAAACAR